MAQLTDKTFIQPTNSQREPAKFNPQIQKVSARRPKYAAPNSPRSDSDGSSIFDRYDDSDQELDSLGIVSSNKHATVIRLFVTLARLFPEILGQF